MVIITASIVSWFVLHLWPGILQPLNIRWEITIHFCLFLLFFSPSPPQHSYQKRRRGTHISRPLRATVFALIWLMLMFFLFFWYLFLLLLLLFVFILFIRVAVVCFLLFTFVFVVTWNCVLNKRFCWEGKCLEVLLTLDLHKEGGKKQWKTHRHCLFFN